MKRVLFDQGTPLPLKKYLPLHAVSTTFELGWSQLQNGDLLAAAEGLFEVFVTTDKNLAYQQDLSGRRLAIVVLPFASWPKLQLLLPAIVVAVDEATVGSLTSIPKPD